MQICIGTIQMRPKDFWDLSPVELYSVIKGFKQFHTVEKDTMSRGELNELMELHPD